MIREAHAMAKLSHPNVVAVYDVEEDAEDVRIVMELVEGQTLSGWSEGRSQWQELLPVYLQAGEGLAAAHAEGLVHRDFKPSNVLVSGTGQVKVADFGIAKGTLHSGDSDASGGGSSVETEARASWDTDSRDSLEADLTEANTVVGTPLYMAPEQATGTTVDARSDQYAFCVALWRALTGTSPFAADNFAEMIQRKLRGRPDLPASVRLPRVIVSALERGLSPRPEDRWPSMRSLLDALEATSRPHSRWQWAAGGVGFAGVMAAIVLGKGPGPCDDVDSALAASWGPQQKASINRALTSFGVEYGESVASFVGAELDAYAQAWVDQRRDICEAKEIRGGASEALTERRLECLSAARSRLDATLEVLSTVEESELPAVVRVTPNPTTLARCGDAKSLLEAIEDEVAEAPTEAQARLATAAALQRLGRAEQAASVLRSLSEDVQEGVAPAFTVELDLELGQALLVMGDSEAAEASIRKAVDRAVEAQNPALMFDSSTALTRLLMSGDGEGTESKLHADLTVALAKRTSARPQDLPQAWSLNGELARARGEQDAAQDAFAKAVELRRKRGGDPIALAEDLGQYAAVLVASQKAAEAVALYEEALGIFERSFGPLHPRCIEIREALSVARRKSGQ
jgi:tetratricopeptide (TPR) repeat protein